LTAELIGLRAAVITSMDNASTAVAKTATAAIPIVFNVGGDPVRLGLVASLARPGGNLTGINFFLNELVAKRLELLRELVPTATRVAVLVNPANAEVTESTLRDVEAAARSMGLQIQILKANTSQGNQCCLRKSGTRAARRPFYCPRSLLHRSTSATHAISGTPCSPGHILAATICGGWRTHELRIELDGRVATGGRLHWPHPQGRQAGRPAGRAVKQV